MQLRLKESHASSLMRCVCLPLPIGAARKIKHLPLASMAPGSDTEQQRRASGCSSQRGDDSHATGGVRVQTTYMTYMELDEHGRQTQIHLANYSLRHRRDGRAGTTILFHLRNYRQTHSPSVMTTGRTELLEHGHHRRYCRGRRTFQGLLAGWSSGQTKAEYTATSG